MVTRLTVIISEYVQTYSESYCTPETNTGLLYVNYGSLKKKFFKIKVLISKVIL